MKRVIEFFLLMAIASATFAEPTVMSAVNLENHLLRVELDSCAVLVSRGIFLGVRLGTEDEADWALQAKCIESGKTSVKVSFGKIKNAFANNQPPSALTDWRLEWMAAFGSAELQRTDSERVYLQRVEEASRNVNRATNKLEIALE